MSQNILLYNSLAFEEGTLLKKFYFKDYRYSEDLDFTLTDDTVSNEAIQNAFNEVFEFEIKARHKGLDPDSLSAKIDSKVNVFKSRWENSMKDQIAELPPFEQVHRELGKHFRLLFK